MRMEHLIFAIIILVIVLAVVIGVASDVLPNFTAFIDTISHSTGVKG